MDYILTMKTLELHAADAIEKAQKKAVESLLQRFEGGVDRNDQTK
jgi:hypothetical protein